MGRARAGREAANAVEAGRAVEGPQAIPRALPPSTVARFPLLANRLPHGKLSRLRPKVAPSLSLLGFQALIEESLLSPRQDQ